MKNSETYLGDSVYASYDCGMIRLRTGEQTIWLEPEVYMNLERYAATIWPKKQGG